MRLLPTPPRTIQEAVEKGRTRPALNPKRIAILLGVLRRHIPRDILEKTPKVRRRDPEGRASMAGLAPTLTKRIRPSRANWVAGSGTQQRILSTAKEVMVSHMTITPSINVTTISMVTKGCGSSDGVDCSPGHHPRHILNAAAATWPCRRETYSVLGHS